MTVGSSNADHQLLAEGVVALDQKLIFALDFARRIDVHDARIAIEHQCVALEHGFHQMLDADHGGNLEGARENRRVRSDAARLQSDTDEIFVRHQRHLRQRQLVGDENGGLAESVLLVFLPQVAQHAMANVAKIGRAFAQITVGDRKHLRAQLIDHAKERTLRGEAVVDRLADAADELLILENQAMAVEDFEFRLGHQRFHADLERGQFGARARQRLFEPPDLGAGIADAQVPIDRTEKRADDMGDAARETWRGGQADQARAANFDRRGEARGAADLFVTLELAIRLDHAAAIFVAFFFLGREGFAQLKAREDLRDLSGSRAQQADLLLTDLATAQSLDDQNANRLLPPLLHRHAEKRVIALLAGLGEVFVTRMAHRVFDHHGSVRFDGEPDEALAHTHRDTADRITIEADGRAQDQTLVLRIEEIERADLDLQTARDSTDNPVQRFAQVVGGFAADRGDAFDQRKSITIGSHD